MDKQLSKAEDDFEWWIMNMDDALDRFLDSLPTGIHEKLDFSLQSLKVLEAWLLERYPNLKALLAPEQTLILDGKARYVGETLREVAGGHWSIILDDPQYVDFGIPILKDTGTPPMAIAPITLVTTATHRRTGTYLHDVLQRLICNK